MSMTDTIVLKVPDGTKARWVRQSQAASMKLSDWVLRQIEPPDPDPWLARYANKEVGSVAVLTEPELREVMRKAYLAGAYRA